MKMFFFQQQNQPSQNDTPQEVDFNPGLILEKLDSWLDGFVRLLPNIGIAILVIIAFYFLGRLTKNMVNKIAVKRDRHNLGEMLGSLLKYTVIVIGVMLGLTIVVPSIKPGDLIAGLGVSSVAIGFAFKDILQNWLAGLLILIRQPFEIDDQIVVNDFEGTVEKIETRATIIRTYSGERIVIPNNDIYTNAVRVNTAYELRRSQYDVGIGYADNLEEAIQEIEKSIENIEGIDKDKGVEVLPWELATSWVTLRVRWWTKTSRADVVSVFTKVIPAIKHALDEARIDMPYETQVHLFHDQTESTDGDREKQREGWPADKKEKSVPRWKAEKENGVLKDE